MSSTWSYMKTVEPHNNWFVQPFKISSGSNICFAISALNMLINSSLSKDFHESEIGADLSKFIEKVNKYHVVDPVLKAVNNFQDSRQHDHEELLAKFLGKLGV